MTLNIKHFYGTLTINEAAPDTTGILNFLNIMQMDIQQIGQLATQLQTRLDEVQLAIQTHFENLQANIAQLQLSGGTPAEREAIAASLQASMDDLLTTLPGITDVPTDPIDPITP